MSMTFLSMANASAVALERIPELTWDEFAQGLTHGIAVGRRVAACFALDHDSESAMLCLVLADDQGGRLEVARAHVQGPFPSLTPRCPQVHLFEREIAEQTGLMPLGHPWLKPVRFVGPGHATTPTPGVCDFYRVQGREVHEVAVGPVHAGIIEPGHFRFQCHGEEVMHLEIALGYQHRGVESAMVGAHPARAYQYMQTLAGDTTIGHGLAYMQIVEAMADASAPPRAMAIRGLALELERLANHIGDLGALANDVGFLPTSSYCGRIRGDVLNMTAALCGSRFGRSLLTPGGVAFDIEPARAHALLQSLAVVARDTGVAVNLLWNTPSVMARFEDTGTLSAAQVQALGMVGPTARAAGLERDVRHDFPAGIYRFSHIPPATWKSGDVFARAYVRWLEIQRSFAFVQDQLGGLPQGPCSRGVGTLPPRTLAVSLVEGWRGEICHVALTDQQGHFARYKVVDPSFHNWVGLALALRGQPISDFPLCNKSFNLSYCGHDL